MDELTKEIADELDDFLKYVNENSKPRINSGRMNDFYSIAILSYFLDMDKNVTCIPNHFVAKIKIGLRYCDKAILPLDFDSNQNLVYKTAYTDFFLKNGGFGGIYKGIKKKDWSETWKYWLIIGLTVIGIVTSIIVPVLLQDKPQKPDSTKSISQDTATQKPVHFDSSKNP